MALRTCLALSLAVASLLASRSGACCPAFPPGKRVVNADQTVIIIWDAASKTEHFIRQASFKSEADDFGFIVPTPIPQQQDEAFPGEPFPVLCLMPELPESLPS